MRWREARQQAPQGAGKIRLATVWLSGCSGCHMSLLDLDEAILDLARRVNLVYSPLVDAKEFPEGVDVTLVEGAVANEENLDEIRRIRIRTRVLVALRDCAVTGNIPALRNPIPPDQVLRAAYSERATIPAIPGDGQADGYPVPALLPRVRAVHEVVPVDVFLPGCPPAPGRIVRALQAILDGRPVTLASEDIRFG